MLDCGFCFVGGGNFQSGWLWCLFFGGDDFDGLIVFDLCLKWYVYVVDFGVDNGVVDLCVDCIGEINWGCFMGKFYYIVFGCKIEYLI